MTRPGARRPDTPRKATTDATGTASRLPLIGVAVVIAVAALAAVLTARQPEPAAAPTQPPSTAAPAVTIDGAALPALGRGADPAVGQAAPVVRAADFAGDPVTLGGASGTPQVVVFLAHWCPHCQREVPALQAWLDADGAPEGVELVSVSTAEEPTGPNHPPAAWLDREGWTLPVAVDDGDAVADAYGLSGLPFFVFLDADGRVVQRHAGELTIDQLAVSLDDLRAGGTAAR